MIRYLEYMFPKVVSCYLSIYLFPRASSSKKNSTCYLCSLSILKRCLDPLFKCFSVSVTSLYINFIYLLNVKTPFRKTLRVTFILLRVRVWWIWKVNLLISKRDFIQETLKITSSLQITVLNCRWDRYVNHRYHSNITRTVTQTELHCCWRSVFCIQCYTRSTSWIWRSREFFMDFVVRFIFLGLKKFTRTIWRLAFSQALY